MEIIFRKWVDGTLSVCNGTNHYRQLPNGEKKWFERCPYSNPYDSHKRIHIAKAEGNNMKTKRPSKNNPQIIKELIAALKYISGRIGHLTTEDAERISKALALAEGK